jgi:uncharacterized phosphosugar-binding protein
MNKELLQYQAAIGEIVAGIVAQEPVLREAAAAAARAVAADGLLHVIGPGGHSNMAAEEVLWRAGGPAFVNAILDPGTNLIHGAKRSNYVERLPGYAARVFDAYRLGRVPGEVIVIVNAYGINAMCIDSALEARKRGMVSIGITSRAFADKLAADHPSRHPSCRNLYQEVDFFIDNRIPYGDAAVNVEGVEPRVGPTATICNVVAINCLMVEIVKALKAMGVDPPIWTSANLPGGDEKNRRMEEKYIPRVKHLG